MRAHSAGPEPREQEMLDSKTFIAIGFGLCLIAALAYVFVFADAQFVKQDVQLDGYVEQPAAQ
jgi:hypothetical protein